MLGGVLRIRMHREILDLIWAKKRGKVGRQPHMIPVAISPLLDSKHEICYDDRRRRAKGRTYDHKSILPLSQD